VKTSNHWVPLILGVTLAIAITTTMDASGYSAFSALPLMPLFGLLWWWQKFTKAEIGFKVINLAIAIGFWRYYGSSSNNSSG
jgi:hypothetical protein